MAASTRSSCSPAVRPVSGSRLSSRVVGVEGLSVEGDGAQFGGLELDEGVAVGAGGEADDGAGVEGVVAARSGRVSIA